MRPSTSRTTRPSRVATLVVLLTALGPAIAGVVFAADPGADSGADPPSGPSDGTGAWRAETSEDFMSGARTGLAVRVLASRAGDRRPALTVGCSGALPLRAMYAPGVRLGTGAVPLQYRVDDGPVREVDGFPGSDGRAAIVLDDALVPRLLAGRTVRLRAIDARGTARDAEFPLGGLVDALDEACGWSEAFRALTPAAGASDAVDLAATFAGLSKELSATSPLGTAERGSRPVGREDTLEIRAAGSGPGPEASDARASVRRDDPPGALDRDGATLRREVQVRLRAATARWKARLRAAIVPHAALDPRGCAALVEVDETGGVGAVSVEGCPEREARALRRAIDVAAPLPLPATEHAWRPRVGLAFD